MIFADGVIPKTGGVYRDKFGDYGIIEVCIWRLDGNQLIVQDPVICCRAQGKRTSTFPPFDDGNETYARLINFKQTDRNGLAKAVPNKFGFTTAAEGRLERTVNATTFAADFIHITPSALNDSALRQAPLQQANDRT